MLLVRSHRASVEKLKQQYPDVLVLDLTSKGAHPWVRFSPFYPHGNIPVPFSPGYVSASVEGIWQGLKVFEWADIDTSKFRVSNMKGLKRSVRSFGNVRGHREGVEGQRLLSYAEARHAIYLPTYLWMLEHCMREETAELRRLSMVQTVILLDYETNCDLDDLRRPLSHAGLVTLYLEGKWPERQGI